MAKRLFQLRSCMGYSPAAGESRLVIHACKGGVVGEYTSLLFGQTAPRDVSLTFAWDDGSGEAIRPLASVFAQARHVFILSDASPYGVVALYNMTKVLRSASVTWTSLGIDDSWLSGIVSPDYSSLISKLCIPTPQDMRNISIKQLKEMGIGQLGTTCEEIIKSGRVLELEAFINSELRIAIAALLRSRLAVQD